MNEPSPPLVHVGKAWRLALHDPELALKLGLIATAEHFDPAIFAAMCSLDMNTATRRLGDFKRFVGAWRLDVEVTDYGTTIGFRCKHRPEVPPTMGLAEWVFQVAFTRRLARAPGCQGELLGLMRSPPSGASRMRFDTSGYSPEQDEAFVAGMRTRTGIQSRK